MKNTFFRIWLFVSCLCLVESCSTSKNASIGSAARKIFSDFAYVGEFSGETFAPPPHDGRSRSLPVFLKPDTLYVFHNPRKVDEQEFATGILPARLCAAGFTVLKAPATLQDLVFVDPGGAVWKIRFRFGSQHGALYNVLDKKRYHEPSTTASTDTDDYILKIDK